MSKKVLILIATLVAVLLVSCQAAPTQVTDRPPLKADITPAPATAPAWEQAWNKSVVQAKKEGKVFVYATSQVRDAFKPFTQKYGIEVDVVVGRGGEISTRLLSERRAGLALSDVYQGGATTLMTSIKPSGILAPLDNVLVLPEVLDETKWLNGRLPFVDKERMIVSFIAGTDPDFVINTSLARADELKSYPDILNPKWKGKIVINDPTTAGSGLKWFGLIVRASLGPEKGKEWMKNLAKQEPMITRDQRLQMDWLAIGKYAIAVAPQRELIDEFQKLGAPIAPIELFELADISPGSGNLAMISNAPHPNAAKLFINWLLTREGQNSYVQVFGSPSARIDASTQGLDPTVIPDPRKKYFIPDEGFYTGQTDMRELAVEIFGHLLK